MRYVNTLRLRRAILATAATLGILASAAGAEVLRNIDDSGEWAETRYTDEDVFCEPTSKYGDNFALLREAYGVPYALNRLTYLADNERVYVVVQVAGDQPSFEESTAYIVFGVTVDALGNPDEVCVVATAVKAGEAL